MSAGSTLLRTARGAGWVVGWRVTTRLLGLANSLVLLKLLAPGDFGLVALATGLSQSVASLSELGMEDALVRDPSDSRHLYDAAFTVNLLRGCVIAALIVALAWPAAMFFDDVRLTGVLLVLAACEALGAVENVGMAQFRRSLDFSKEFQLKIAPRLAAIAVGVGVALVWRSYWALLLGILTSQALTTALSYAMHPFRPRLSLAAWGQLSSFSRWSWAISVVSIVRERVDSFVIGRALGMSAVGLYTVGADIASMPTYELGASVARASLPGFAASHREGADPLPDYLRLVGSVVLIGAPAGVGLSLVADQVAPLILGPQWGASVGIIRVVAIAYLTVVVSQVTRVLMTAHALLRSAFWLNVSAVAVRVVAMVALTPAFGLAGALAALVIALLAEDALTIGFAFRRFGIGAAPALARVWRPVAAASVMAGALWAAGLGWVDWAGRAPTAGSLLTSVLAGGGIYAAALVTLWRASGRPDGAERDLASVLRRAVSRGLTRSVRR